MSAKHSELTRLTLHAVPAGSSQCTQVASTVAGRRGKASAPEGLEALRTGAEVVLDEPGAVDVTVPILAQNGTATAVAGVTLRAETSLDRPSVVAKARAIAKELEAEVRAANKPLQERGVLSSSRRGTGCPRIGRGACSRRPERPPKATSARTA